eukprot:18313-Heterococcus_DN1.PRE.2
MHACTHTSKQSTAKQRICGVALSSIELLIVCAKLISFFTLLQRSIIHTLCAVLAVNTTNCNIRLLRDGARSALDH